MMDWKVGDWAIFDLRIVQIKKLKPYCEVSDGSFCTSGELVGRIRPLTLNNKATIEYFDHFYKELYKIRGELGFNFPEISNYFNHLALRQIDEAPGDRSITDKAADFVRAAKEYQPVIDGIYLFRENRR